MTTTVTTLTGETYIFDRDFHEWVTTVDTEEVESTKTMNITPEGKEYAVSCHNKDDLSVERILKTLSALKGQLMLECAPIRVKYIECKMSPAVRKNLIQASRRLAMYGKERPFIARFDEYGRRLPDEIKIETMEGVKIQIIDPTEYDENELYLALRGVVDNYPHADYKPY
jgi:hypothetical protein